MLKITNIFPLILLTCALYSCKKEDGNNGTAQKSAVLSGNLKTKDSISAPTSYEIYKGAWFTVEYPSESSAETDGNINKVFGLKYAVEKDLARYQEQYLHFKNSLEQYAD